MKQCLKSRGVALLGSTMVAAFLLLHYFVYLDNASGEVPLVQSYTDAPVDLEELTLCEALKPTYLHPFRKVQFSYQSELEIGFPECTIVERATSRFTSSMEPVQGDPYAYWDGFDEDGFGRPQVGYTYANPLFFIVQYGLLLGFIGLMIGPCFASTCTHPLWLRSVRRSFFV